MSAELDGLRSAAMGAPEQTVTDVNVAGVWMGSRYHLTITPKLAFALLDALEDEQWLRRCLESQVAEGDDGRTMRFGALRALLRTTRPLGLEGGSDDAGSPVRPADDPSGREAGRDGEGL